MEQYNKFILKKILTSHDILGGCGGIKIDIQILMGALYGQIVKNLFTHTQSLWAVTEKLHL